MTLPHCKCVVVGDGTIGKTCMLSVYAMKGYPGKYIPTIFDNYSATVEVDGVPIQLQLWDTAGQEEFDKLRPLSYPNTDVFMVCFAVDNRTSFLNVKEKWFPDLQQEQKPHGNAQLLLVGTKSDRRGDADAGTPNFVTPEEAETLRSEIGAIKYVECSAAANVNVKQVFDEAIKIRFKNEMVKLKAALAQPQQQPAAEVVNSPDPVPRTAVPQPNVAAQSPPQTAQPQSSSTTAPAAQPQPQQQQPAALKTATTTTAQPTNTTAKPATATTQPKIIPKQQQKQNHGCTCTVQ